MRKQHTVTARKTVTNKTNPKFRSLADYKRRCGVGQSEDGNDLLQMQQDQQQP